MLTDTVPVERPGNERSERAAAAAAERLRSRLLAEADDLRAARTRSTLGALLDRWMAQHEVDQTTRDTYNYLIRKHIRPALGDVALTLLMRNATERLERHYAELRRCSKRCSGRPFIEHEVQSDHDCAKQLCRPHQCTPLAASSVRQIHAVISGALTAAARWGWIPYNPASKVKLPAKHKPEPKPPTAAQMAQIIEEAWWRDAEFGLFVWLSAVTGSRRGEVLATRFDNYDLDEVGEVWFEQNWVRTSAGLVLKETKTHQKRRLSLDKITVDLIRQHKAECARQLEALGVPMTGREFVFSAEPDLSRARDPSAMTRRFSRLVRKLSIDTQLKQLRHYSATDLLTAGIDLRTVAGRLGHGDGTTTLRHYAAWVASADRHAADTIGSRMPLPPGYQEDAS